MYYSFDKICYLSILCSEIKLNKESTNNFEIKIVNYTFRTLIYNEMHI